MTLRLTFAADLHGLFARASAEIHAAWIEPLRPPPLVFPNEKSKFWFCREWRKQYGGFANLDADLLERRLWETLQPAENQAQLRGEMLAQLTIAALAEWFAEKDFPESLRAYLTQPLSAARGLSGSAKIHPVRLTQLGVKLAGLFIEYENSRPDNFLTENAGILSAWSHTAFFSLAGGKREDETEIWQRELYRRIFAKNGILERAAQSAAAETHEPRKRYLTLPQLYREQREKLEAARACPLFIFSFAGVGQFHRVVINHLAQTQNVHVYLLNPCQEYWQDIFRQKPKITENPAENWDERGADGAEIPEILRQWGRGGAENIFLWCEQADYEFAFSERAPRAENTLLAQVQNSLLTLRNQMKDFANGDRSLTITPAPSRLREVEFLRSQIWRDLQNDAHLRLDDLRVWCPALDQYRAAIAQVFGAGGDDALPYAFADYAEKSALTEQALAAFFALLPAANGEFNRTRIFAFLRNPLVGGARRIDEKTLEIWERWAENLNAYRDLPDQNSPHHLNRGIRRLLLGQLTSSPFRADPNSPVEIPYADLEARDADILEKFCATLDDLRQWNERLRKSPSEMLAAMEQFCQTWIRPDAAPSLKNRETAILNAVKNALENLRWQIRAGRKTLDLLELQTAMLDTCARTSANGHDFFTGGVTFAKLAVAQALPSRCVYLLGMNAADFPPPNSRDTLDLRVKTAARQSRWPGDLDNEKQGGWLLLEQLLAAQTALRISYLGKNPQKDEQLEPAAPVAELGAYLRSATAGRWREDEMLPFLPREAEISSRRDFHRWLAAYREPENSARKSAENPPVLAREFLSIPPVVFLRDLKKFAENPFLFQVEKTLGRTRETDETADLEPIGIDRFAAAEMRKTRLRRAPDNFANPNDGAADAEKAAAELLAAQLADWQARGKIPAEFYLRKELANWRMSSEVIAQKLRADFAGYDRGLSSLPDSVELEIAGQKTSLRPLPCDISTLRQNADGDYLWLTAKKNLTSNAAFIDGYLLAVFLAAAGKTGDWHALGFDDAGKDRQANWRFASVADAQKILSSLIARAFGEKQAVNLPLEMLANEAEKAEKRARKNDGKSAPLRYAQFAAELTEANHPQYGYYPNFHAQILDDREWRLNENDAGFYQQICEQQQLFPQFFPQLSGGSESEISAPAAKISRLPTAKKPRKDFK